MPAVHIAMPVAEVAMVESLRNEHFHQLAEEFIMLVAEHRFKSGIDINDLPL
jgi:hypothetical protein